MAKSLKQNQKAIKNRLNALTTIKFQKNVINISCLLSFQEASEDP
jgi:hypothetical protein